MIAFASLFLGLLVGVRPVTVIVGETVAAVAFELDGRSVGRVTAAPWTMDVNFGGDFEPHELVARAFDAKGEEVALARQWINLPRPPAEVEIVLERDPKGRATAARLTWDSILGVSPNRVTVTFDGRPLSVAQKRASLPAYDPETTHVLTAVLDFPNGVRSRSDVVLGGGSEGDAKSELTAVPIQTDGPEPPKIEALRGKFLHAGQPLVVAAVERGPAEIVLVRDLDTAEARAALLRKRYGILPLGDASFLERGDHIRILWPVARRILDSGKSNELFETSREFPAKTSSLRFLLTDVEYPGALSPRRFADAVAVAGLRACGAYARRAVVLVLGGAPDDASLYEPGAVRRYLATLRVPLFVWSVAPPRPPGSPAASAWGTPEDVSTNAGLDLAADRLRRELARQSVVWVEGRYLPQAIALAEPAAGITLVR